jgi:hypothetical protein
MVKAPGSTEADGTTKELLFYISGRLFLFAFWKYWPTVKSFRNMVSIAAEIPDGLLIPAYTEADLPKDWNANVPPPQRRTWEAHGPD